MRKYIHIAKAVTPVLTEEAANHIAEEYSRLRSQEQLGADIARVSKSSHTITHTLLCTQELTEYKARTADVQIRLSQNSMTCLY